MPDYIVKIEQGVTADDALLAAQQLVSRIRKPEAGFRLSVTPVQSEGSPVPPVRVDVDITPTSFSARVRGADKDDVEISRA